MKEAAALCQLQPLVLLLSGVMEASCRQAGSLLCMHQTASVLCSLYLAKIAQSPQQTKPKPQLQTQGSSSATESRSYSVPESIKTSRKVRVNLKSFESGSNLGNGVPLQ